MFPTSDKVITKTINTGHLHAPSHPLSQAHTWAIWPPGHVCWSLIPLELLAGTSRFGLLLWCIPDSNVLLSWKGDQEWDHE